MSHLQTITNKFKVPTFVAYKIRETILKIYRNMENNRKSPNRVFTFYIQKVKEIFVFRQFTVFQKYRNILCSRE